MTTVAAGSRITEASIEFARSIEAQVYPSWMQQLQDVEDLSDLADYCECKASQVRLITGTGWYLIAAEKGRSVEVVDICALLHAGPLGMREVIETLLKEWAGKKISMDARESTSYPLVQAICRTSGAQVLKDEIWDWDGEQMHEMCIQL